MTYINGYPDDAAEIASLVRQADLSIAVRLLQVWGSKQRDLGALKSPEIMRAGLESPLSRKEPVQP